jgi:peptide-methionine (R)-S-oxide reductase
LYRNERKFESGTGWPSFDKPIEGGVFFSTDNKLGYTRNEVLCSKCGGHLGHVFDDGPRETTGKRYCMNGAAMDFVPNKNQ